MDEKTTDLDQAAVRGNPSFVWRAGQERRLSMVRQWAPLEGKRVLDVGSGVGIYLSAFGRYTSHAAGIEIESERAREARQQGMAVVQAVGEALPFAENAFDVVFSHEVIEHVRDDRQAVAEMARVTAPGGRIVIFCPNRWYPFETHGHFWRGEYHFGNTPLINYLPDRWRDRLAPHVRAYSARRLYALFDHLDLCPIHHRQIFPGYDNLAVHSPSLGRCLRLSLIHI